MDIVEIRDLKKYFRDGSQVVKALDGVNLSIEKGKFTAIVGASFPSGTFQSATALKNQVCQFEQPLNSEIRIACHGASHAEETVFSKVQGKLLQYYEKMKDEQQQNRQDKHTIQELVSDISHQVNTPTANIQMIISNPSIKLPWANQNPNGTMFWCVFHCII